jgi:multisubunit Na+/H+ antiporter MnhB subunit
VTPDLTFPGMVLISSSIIVGGILIGALTFAIDVPYASCTMVVLAALIVLGATMLVLSTRNQGGVPSR